MTDKELRRMSRADLVEIIYEVRKNEAALQEEVDSLKKQLEEKQKKVSRAGTLAELSAGMNGLFEAAQATADQYLQEISEMYEYARKIQNETERRASAVAKQAMKERKELLEKTEEECQRMKEAAGHSVLPGSAPRKKEEAEAGRPAVRGVSQSPVPHRDRQRSAAQRASAEAVSYREMGMARKNSESPEIVEEQADRSATREIPVRKRVQESAPRKRTSAPRKSARPVTMNDRRKMQ